MSQGSSANSANRPHRDRDTQSAPRVILVDDNIRDQGGHYFELASLLLAGAEQLGYRCVLATHSEFDAGHIAGKNWEVQRIFHTRRLVRWSLGVDGRSKYQRDLAGKPVGGSPVQNALTRARDFLCHAGKRPDRMLGQWSDDLVGLLAELRPTSADSLLINTCDDFALLSLAQAMKRANVPPMRIDALFHFALYETGQTDGAKRLRQLGRQIRSAVSELRPHDVHLHATTDALAEQLRETESGCAIRSIPYPTRSCKLGAGSIDEPLNAVIAGMPRAEKGKDAIAELLLGIDESLLKPGRYRLSMQLPAERWRTMVPLSMRRCCEESMPGESMRPLEIITSRLSTETYHRWLSSADLGLFLYEPTRYVARCSGVLLEMLARGVPVIVPDQTWLADQVRQAGGHRSIGFIYQDRSEIPDLMRQFAMRRSEIQPKSRAHAATIAERHRGVNSLLAMGLEPACGRQHAA